MVFSRKIRFGSVFIIISLLLMCCTRQKVVDIGMVVSLSGTYSPDLRTARNGALLAVEQINDRKERVELNLIIEDDKSDNLAIIDSTRKLIEQNIDILLMSVVSGAYAQIEDLIDKSDVLVLSPTISSDKFKNKDDNLFRMTMDSSQYGEALAAYALKEDKMKFSIIYDTNNSAYAVSMITAFIDVINSEIRNPDIQIVDFNTNESPSFPELGDKIMEQKPDSVLIIANPLDSALICQHINEGAILKLLSNWAFSSEFLENGGQAIEGVVSFVRSEFSKDTVEYQKFYTDYLERFGSEPSYQALTNFNSINYLYSLIDSQESSDPESLKKAIIESGGYQGINIEYQIDEYGDCTFPLLPYTVLNGQITKI